MNNYKISTIDDNCLKFRGNLIASVQSSRLATSQGDICFELTAYEHENQQWVTTIAMKIPGGTDGEIFAFYCTNLLVAAEDFLYDFEPIRVLSSDVAADSIENRPLLAAVDRAYYAAVRKLTSEMESHQQWRSQNTKVEPANVKFGWVEEWMVDRLRQWRNC